LTGKTRKKEQERASTLKLKPYAGLNITEFSKLSLFPYEASYALRREILLLIFTFVKRFAKEVDRKDKKERAGESSNAQIKALCRAQHH